MRFVVLAELHFGFPNLAAAVAADSLVMMTADMIHIHKLWRRGCLGLQVAVEEDCLRHCGFANRSELGLRGLSYRLV
jgi:hypothetical protein